MFNRKDFVIGYAPTRRNVFSVEDALKYKRMVYEKLKGLNYNIVDIEDINDEGLVSSNDDISPVIKKFKENNVDCIFSPHCNFGTESAVAKIGNEIRKPFLLWGPRDEAPLPDGSRLRDSQCGLFATSKILQRFNIPFTYIVNSRVDSMVFEKGLSNFFKASNVVKSFKKIKIGQVGVRPGDFWSVIYNEGELIEKFNIEVIPFNLFDIVSKIKVLLKKPDESFYYTYNFIKENIKVNIEDKDLKTIVALKEVLKKLCLQKLKYSIKNN